MTTKWNTLVAIGMMMAGLALGACSGKTNDARANERPLEIRKAKLLGDFNVDSAYNYIAKQVAFGPRVIGTEAHDACAKYLVDEFRRLGVDSVVVQNGQVTTYTGETFPIKNIIAGINIENARRIILLAHYDTRPWADQDENPANRKQSFDGANDGASGVGVLMEITRNLVAEKPGIGVDIMLVDAEDYGDSSSFDAKADTWCLGSQYWVENGMPPYGIENKPIYGILLDMVGGRDARFYYEAYSAKHAETPSIKVWSEAANIGHDDRFIRRVGGAITDDHMVLTQAGIPTTDIIEMNNPQTSSFNPTWHTKADNLQNIDRRPLKAVGETVLNVIYKEKPF